MAVAEKTFSLEDFVRLGVLRAGEIARNGFDHDEFYDKWIEGISDEMNISPKLARELHHPIYWVLFNRDNGSYIERVESRRVGEKPRVKLKREYNESDLNSITNIILEKYRDYYDSRVCSLGL